MRSIVLFPLKPLKDCSGVVERVILLNFSAAECVKEGSIVRHVCLEEWGANTRQTDQHAFFLMVSPVAKDRTVHLGNGKTTQEIEIVSGWVS